MEANPAYGIFQTNTLTNGNAFYCEVSHLATAKNEDNGKELFAEKRLSRPKSKSRCQWMAIVCIVLTIGTQWCYL